MQREWRANRDANPADPETPSVLLIELRIGETERAVNELERRLIASDRGLYQRGGVIVSPAR